MGKWVGAPGWLGDHDAMRTEYAECVAVLRQLPEQWWWSPVLSYDVTSTQQLGEAPWDIWMSQRCFQSRADRNPSWPVFCCQIQSSINPGDSHNGGGPGCEEAMCGMALFWVGQVAIHDVKHINPARVSLIDGRLLVVIISLLILSSPKLKWPQH